MNNFFVDYRISNEELFNLKKLNINIVKCPKCDLLYDAVNGHPDILINIIGNNHILVHRDMDEGFLEYLKILGYKITLSRNSLENKYPKNIILNAVNSSDYFIHNLKYTDENLLNTLSKSKIINVNQGYAKCSCAVLSANALITSDNSIYKALQNTDIDVLLIPPGDILLPGLDYGFIGGCCGLIDKNQLAFFGDLNFYYYGSEVLDFLRKHAIEAIYLRHGKLIDRGSLLGYRF